MAERPGSSCQPRSRIFHVIVEQPPTVAASRQSAAVYLLGKTRRSSERLYGAMKYSAKP